MDLFSYVQPTQRAPVNWNWHPYQSTTLDLVRAYIAKGGKSGYIVVPTGGGKGPLQAQICCDFYDSGMRGLSIVHTQELVSQNALAFDEIGRFDVPVGVYSAGLDDVREGGARDVDHAVVVGGIQSCYSSPKKFGWRDFLVLDECFVAGTKVFTKNGSVNIEELNVGDAVQNATGTGVVLHLNKSVPNALVRVILSNGGTIVCTPNHPFFTNKGWTQAKDCEGLEVFSSEDVRCMLQRVSPQNKNFTKKVGRPKNMLETMFNFRNVENKFSEKSCSCKSNRSTYLSGKRVPGVQNFIHSKRWKARIQSLGRDRLLHHILLSEASGSGLWRGLERKNIINNEIKRSSTAHARWKWSRSDRASIETSLCTRSELGGRAYCCYKNGHRKRVSTSLQARFGQHSRQGLRRSGWWISRTTCPKSSRSQEGQFLTVKRVDSLSSEECASAGFVYNLQVSGHPSYFAGGILVHNCDYGANGGMIDRLITGMRAINPNLIIIGMSATVFDPIPHLPDRIHSIKLRELIDGGFLVPMFTRKTKTKINTDNVKMTAGDFNIQSLDRTVNVEEITRGVISDILSLAYDRKKIMLFGVGVEHAQNLQMEAIKQGLPCEIVTGDLESTERRGAIEAFRNASERHAISSMGVLTTGFNVRPVDCIALVRPTRSPRLYTQICGRGSRTAPGKLDCLILDYGNVVSTLGPVDLLDQNIDAVKKRLATKDKRPAIKWCDGCFTAMDPKAEICGCCGKASEKKIAPLDENKFKKLKTRATGGSILSDGTIERIREDLKPGEDLVRVKSRIGFTIYAGKAVGQPSSLRVSYSTTKGSVSDWLAFGAPEAWKRKRAEAFWLESGLTGDIPQTAEDAARIIDQAESNNYEVVTPPYLLIKKNEKTGYHNIQRAVFDTAERTFDTATAAPLAVPRVAPLPTGATIEFASPDDGIPF
jgi:superfamily II DNA or RNA helicase